MKAKKIPYIWISPLITLAILLVLYAIEGIFPFGTATTAFSDGISQYLPFLAEFGRKLREGGSLFFTWNAGMGVNFWANIAYYLASPLNLLAYFVSPANVDKLFAVITLIKPVLMALTFGIFLKYAYKKQSVSTVVFSVAWSLSAFIIGGFTFDSWHDSLIYFPIVLLGLHRLTEGKSAVLYALFLGLTIASNFYIGWIVCIFCVIYYIYLLIVDDEVRFEGVTSEKNEDYSEDSLNIFKTLKESYLLSTFFRFVFSSLIAGAFSAIMTLPTIYALSNTGKGTYEPATVNFHSLWGILASHIYPIENTFETLISTDCIFSFVGIASVILAVAYFFAKGIPMRKKIGNLFLLAVMWLSIIFHAVYQVWHGFGIPAGLMYRFAFVYSFVLIKIAYEALDKIEELPVCGILAGTLFSGVCVAGVYFDNTFNSKFYSPQLIALLSVIVVIFTAILLFMRAKPKSREIMSVVLLAALIGETVLLNAGHINRAEFSEELGNYSTVEKVKPVLKDGERIHFDIADPKFSLSVMYDLIFGINGTEYYSSMADSDFTLSIADMGSFSNRNNYQNGAKEQTPVYNMLFPTVYYLDGSGNMQESFYREKVSEVDGYTLYKNNYAMPFMYTVNDDVLSWDPFLYYVCVDGQNAAGKAFTGTEENLLTYNKNENFKYENCTHISTKDKIGSIYEDNGAVYDGRNDDYYDYLESHMVDYAYQITDMTKKAVITYESVAQEDGIMYLYIDTTEFTELAVKLNGRNIDAKVYGVGEDRMYELGEVKKGDVAEITVGGYNKDFSNGEQVYFLEKSMFTSVGFTINKEKLDNAYNKLDAMSDTELLEFRDTYVKAKVTSYEDGMLYIPTAYDEGWTILIDGEKVPLYEHESHILMTEITKGEHTVEMKYMPVGLVPGAVITGASVLILIAWAVISVNRFKKSKKSDTISENSVSEE